MLNDNACSRARVHEITVIIAGRERALFVPFEVGVIAAGPETSAPRAQGDSAVE